MDWDRISGQARNMGRQGSRHFLARSWRGRRTLGSKMHASWFRSCSLSSIRSAGESHTDRLE
jgi:hypothetical protein